MVHVTHSLKVNSEYEIWDCKFVFFQIIAPNEFSTLYLIRVVQVRKLRNSSSPKRGKKEEIKKKERKKNLKNFQF